jgi:hypothetical protein
MLASLVARYRQKGILVDANLLIGYIVGSLDRRHLRNCRATKTFTSEDFDLLDRFLTNFEQRVTTPHILTGISNLAGRMPRHLHREFRSAFRLVINDLVEEFEPSRSLAARQDFLRFGLTDTAITIVAPGQYLDCSKSEE